MKKIIGLFLGLFFLLSFNIYSSDLVYLKGFFIGKFQPLQSDWDDAKENQLLNGLSGLPESLAFKVVGHADSSGSDDDNLFISNQRAEIVQSKISQLYPDTSIEVLRKIYKPEEGQKVNYRGVFVEVYSTEPIAIASLDDEKTKQIMTGMQDLNANLSNLEKEVNDKNSIPSLMYLFILIPCAILTVIIVLIFRKRNEEERYDWVELNFEQEIGGSSNYLVKCPIVNGQLECPITGYKHKAEKGFKKSVKSIMKNYFLKSESYRETHESYYEMIENLLKKGDIVSQ